MAKRNGAGLPADFNFMRTGKGVLLSNDLAMSAEISARDLPVLARGGGLRQPVADLLASRGFFRDTAGAAPLLKGHFASILKDWAGPRVHIVAVTGNCDHSCAYCGAGAGGADPGRDMSLATARRVVGFIFSTGSRELVIEFQGGEPLRNFPAVRTIVEAALRRNRKAGRKLHFSLVSNLSLLTPEKLAYLCSRNVTVCTSLDGPAFLHDRHRKLAAGGSSHAAAVRGIAAVNRLAARHPGFEPVNAICTVTRDSLAHPEAIVDEFLARGVRRIQLGPLEPLGRAGRRWEELGYGPEEFLAFYSRAFDYMLRLNRRGVEVYEKGALMFVRHILSGCRPRYQNLDLLCRLAYGRDGSVYGSDEARLLAESGDLSFRLGGADDSFESLCATPLARALVLSCFPGLVQPRCARCPFSAYCRISPVYNHLAQNSFWGDMRTNGRCRLFTGIFGLIFRKMARSGNRALLRGWTERYN